MVQYVFFYSVKLQTEQTGSSVAFIEKTSNSLANENARLYESEFFTRLTVTYPALWTLS